MYGFLGQNQAVPRSWLLCSGFTVFWRGPHRFLAEKRHTKQVIPQALRAKTAFETSPLSNSQTPHIGRSTPGSKSLGPLGRSEYLPPHDSHDASCQAAHSKRGEEGQSCRGSFSLCSWTNHFSPAGALCSTPPIWQTEGITMAFA